MQTARGYIHVSYIVSDVSIDSIDSIGITHHASRSRTDWHHASRIHDITHNRTICLFRCSAISRPTFVFSSSHSHHGCALCLSLSVLCLVLVQCIDLTTTTICTVICYLRIENLGFYLVNYDPTYYIYIHIRTCMHAYSLVLLTPRKINQNYITCK